MLAMPWVHVEWIMLSPLFEVIHKEYQMINGIEHEMAWGMIMQDIGLYIGIE